MFRFRCRRNCGSCGNRPPLNRGFLSMSMYEDFDAGPASQKKKSFGPWSCLSIMLVGGAFGIVLLCCGGGTGVVWFGMNILSAEIENELRDNELMKEHIGVIES